MTQNREMPKDYDYSQPGNEPDRREESGRRSGTGEGLTVEPWEEGDNTRGLQGGSWDYKEGHTVANPVDEQVTYGLDEQPTEPTQPPDS